MRIQLRRNLCQKFGPGDSEFADHIPSFGYLTFSVVTVTGGGGKSDPHFVTLDGAKIDFQGPCKYQLSGYTGPQAEDFKVSCEMPLIGVGSCQING